LHAGTARSIASMTSETRLTLWPSRQMLGNPHVRDVTGSFIYREHRLRVSRRFAFARHLRIAGLAGLVTVCSCLN
jgi:hypothetical protein